jgi:uncharacterized membrane protein
MEEKRYDQIDILRGWFFIPMFIYHLISAYDLTHRFKTDYSSNQWIKYLGWVRNLYIILAGYSVHLAWVNYKTNSTKPTILGFIKYKLSRTWSILKAAFLITVVSHILFPDYGIKFGILHFIALSTLIITPIAALDSPSITVMFGAIWLYINSNNLIPFSNPIVNTITGKFIHWSAADYFPLNKNLILVIGGLLLGQILTPWIKPLGSSSIFKTLGKNSLELYTSHMIIILIVYHILAKKIP